MYMAYHKSLVRLEPAGSEVIEFTLTFLSNTHSKIVDTFIMDCLADCTKYSITHGVLVENKFYTSDKGAFVCKYNNRVGIKCNKDNVKYLSIYKIKTDSGKIADVVFTFVAPLDLATLNFYLKSALGKSFHSVKHYRKTGSSRSWYEIIVTPASIESPLIENEDS